MMKAIDITDLLEAQANGVYSSAFVDMMAARDEIRGLRESTLILLHIVQSHRSPSLAVDAPHPQHMIMGHAQMMLQPGAHESVDAEPTPVLVANDVCEALKKRSGTVHLRAAATMLTARRYIGALRNALAPLERLVTHYGTNATESGQPHPHQAELDRARALLPGWDVNPASVVSPVAPAVQVVGDQADRVSLKPGAPAPNASRQEPPSKAKRRAHGTG